MSYPLAEIEVEVGGSRYWYRQLSNKVTSLDVKLCIQFMSPHVRIPEYGALNDFIVSPLFALTGGCRMSIKVPRIKTRLFVPQMKDTKRFMLTSSRVSISAPIFMLGRYM